MTVRSAPAKAILLGEHSVVYGRPALAVPLNDLRVEVRVETADARGIHIRSQQTGDELWFQGGETKEPLLEIVRLTLSELECAAPNLELTIDSSIPIASGLGSGAAVSVALVRALADHLGKPLPVERQSALAYRIEEIHHGTPSGIDNTVIAFGTPIRYVRGEPIRRLRLGSGLHLAIGDSGIVSPTAEAVSGVRRRWQADRGAYERRFNAIGGIVEAAESALELGDNVELGRLLTENQGYLRELGVSHPALERLIEAALEAGSLGAKLSGGGMGGVMLALTNAGNQEAVREALLAAGAARVMLTEVLPDLP